MDNGLNVLFDKYIIDILKIINDNPMIQKTKVSEMLNSTSQKIRDLIDELIKIDLIEEKNGLKFNTKYLSLTEEGERIYGLILRMKDKKLDESKKPQTNLSTPSEEGNTIKNQ